MMPGASGGVPPPPAPAPDYPGAGRRESPEYSVSSRRGGAVSPERRGRSRTADRPRQGPVRRIRSSGPSNAAAGQPSHDLGG